MKKEEKYLENNFYSEEPLIFEIGKDGRIGVDFPDLPEIKDNLQGVYRKSSIGLPDLSEPQVVRHYTKISQLNYSIDTCFYPLGSCTMKHNPRINEKVARLPGLADIHPLQPVQTVQGALEIINELSHWLKVLTGMPAIAMWPAAGAHGELCGLMAIRAAHEYKGNKRKKVLVPNSAHGTNPATAAFCGYQIEEIEENSSGRIDLNSLIKKLDDSVAAIMLTNPNTCGVFEKDMITISNEVHNAGAYFYCDGANFNAIVGRVRPADLGIDAMHINLHKTFSTPHGGGGPGAGPTVLSESLSSFAPLPLLVSNSEGFNLIEHKNKKNINSFGRMRAFHGQMGMFVRALAYCLSHGADGLKQVAEDAVLNANYLLKRLSEELTPGFMGDCMHECLFSDDFLKETDINTLDFAKAMIDEGYHPPTMYFPLVVRGALLIEPTETESLETLDKFADTVIDLAKQAKKGETSKFKNAPFSTNIKRLDEVGAARNLKLTSEL